MMITAAISTSSSYCDVARKQSSKVEDATAVDVRVEFRRKRDIKCTRMAQVFEDSQPVLNGDCVGMHLAKDHRIFSVERSGVSTKFNDSASRVRVVTKERHEPGHTHNALHLLARVHVVAKAPMGVSGSAPVRDEGLVAV